MKEIVSLLCIVSNTVLQIFSKISHQIRRMFTAPNAEMVSNPKICASNYYYVYTLGSIKFRTDFFI